MAAQVTESYISQLLGGKKAPPAPERTDIYGRLEEGLGLSAGQLARVAEVQREALRKKRLEEPARPLFKEFRELILRKCEAERSRRMREIFGQEPFGEMERLVTQKLLDVAKDAAREELNNENWVRAVGRMSGQSYEQARVTILDFLDTDVFHVSLDNWAKFMDPLIESWDIDLETFGVEVVLNRRLIPGHFVRRFEYAEREAGWRRELGAGFEAFLRDARMSGDATEEELEFLRGLQFSGRRPTALYYYRELQNLRDRLSFEAEEGTPETGP
jgi:hypothetical protein